MKKIVVISINKIYIIKNKIEIEISNRICYRVVKFFFDMVFSKK